MSIRQLLVVASLAGSALVVSPATAATDVVIAGEAISPAGACLAVEGFSSGSTGRQRWLTAYWEHVSSAPICWETDPHFDPVITCVQAVTVGAAAESATIAYIAATGPARAPYLFKIVDKPYGIDEFGVLAAPPDQGPCGAGAVTSEPVSSGGFVIAAA